MKAIITARFALTDDDVACLHAGVAYKIYIYTYAHCYALIVNSSTKQCGKFILTQDKTPFSQQKAVCNERVEYENAVGGKERRCEV